MKFQFEPDLDYQLEAIDGVCNLFAGQEICRTEFTVSGGQSALQIREDIAEPTRLTLGVIENDFGIGNRLALSDEELLENLRQVQMANGLPPTERLESGDFSVEMETGTGKTYVYLRTIFELNKRFGFTKFVIVVPSIAIKEGVYKQLQSTTEHFKGLYAGAPFEYFVYDSNKPGPVRHFAASPDIQIMVITVGSINKPSVNNFYKSIEQTGGDRPIDLVKATKPILILDEPQSVEGGLEGSGRKALTEMGPLCILRYSATHVHEYNMVYKLDAVDAYERKLVKQIEIASATVENQSNTPYVKLLAVANKRKTVAAKVELDCSTSTGGVKRNAVWVFDGDDLERASGRALYRDHMVGEIGNSSTAKFLELRFPGGEEFLSLGDSYGGVDPSSVHRLMIRRTIKEHLDKELQYRPLGIKILSLFFIDSVGKYRQYTDAGDSVKGEYALIFEEEYARASKMPAYKSLFYGDGGVNSSPELVHGGYFSIDKKGGWLDTTETNAESRENAERAYQLIMREKEALLSLTTPLKFIFSHSALREGWDNPNVFQICSLRDMHSERDRRQTIGRGLRLCVNQDGARIKGHDVNRLTVVANESYEEFAANLQKEIEAETGFRFGTIEPHQFAVIATTSEPGQSVLGLASSTELWNHLVQMGYLDSDGLVQESLRNAIRADQVDLPAAFESVRLEVLALLRKAAGKLDIKDADDRRAVAVRLGKNGKAIYLSSEFEKLWNRIKAKTAYRLNFDDELLVKECAQALSEAPPVPRTRLNWRKADVEIGRGGVEATETSGAYAVALDDSQVELPDILTELEDRTHLTRRSLVQILLASKRIDDFPRNPQQFIELATRVINRCKELLLVEGIKYYKLGDGEYYAQELFGSEILSGYVKNMLVGAKKCIYEDAIFDSTTEEKFALEMENRDEVLLYAKLPGWFTIPTPLGSYNPDWAILIREGDSDHLYFVAETKGSLSEADLRSVEGAKIACGRAHFEALSDLPNPARYVVVRNFSDLLDQLD